LQDKNSAVFLADLGHLTITSELQKKLEDIDFPQEADQKKSLIMERLYDKFQLRMTNLSVSVLNCGVNWKSQTVGNTVKNFDIELLFENSVLSEHISLPQMK
jgi:hypothetical protein